ncbi:fimbria/pilus outer membrane usher protein [Lysobacter enzymogenes]|uniref:fimbria/pilus outer membrane usher protein n=1 Tax=Lysobacter enzymogenes TaxID=69 RepID=UPI001AFC87B9|nr:fimbria/pilus outer membrane usher protein [Lysobacter enzymogenes]QQQ01227.1 fimbrial biogenesis outer membrane usher protein [Lysobacter enzymogenes]
MANPTPRRWRWTRRLAEAMPAGLLLASPPGHAAEPPALPPPAQAGTIQTGATQAGTHRTGIAEAGAAQAANLSLYLEVSLNQTAFGPPQPFELRAGRLYARVATLRAIGFALPGRDGGETLAPDELAGTTVRFDAAQQRVAIDAPLSLLDLRTQRLNAPGADVPRATASPGLLLNYDLYASRDDRSDNATAFVEARAFGLGRGAFADSVLSQTGVIRHYRDDGAPRRTDSIRLDTSWRWSRPESMFAVTVGDVISGQLDWTRPLRLGGVRFGRDFGLQPYRITTPLPTLAGEVAVPSAVDLYVNGIRQYSGEVQPGPFQLTTVPGITGAGSAQLVVTDAFGRVRTLDFPFYAAQQLLAKGLSDWSVSLGVAREDYALRSFEYGSAPLLSADLRYGLSDRLTFQAHGEGGDGVANAGLGAAWLLGRAGVFGASLSHGRDGGDAGWQYTAAYNWSNGRFNFAADTQRTHGDYRDLASRYGLGAPRVSERAVIGWSDARLGSLGLSYVRLLYRGEPPARYAGATWSRNLRSRASLSLSYNQNLDRGADRTVYLGFTLNLQPDPGRPGTQLSVSAQRAGGLDQGGLDQGAIDLSRPVPGDGGFGWRLQARGGDSEEGALAEAAWLTETGRVNLGYARQGSRDYGYASASGALVWMGGHAFAARSVSDAFAVVSTGVPGVPVLLENRPFGRTDADGMLLVTPLNAWQRNRIGIDPMELPADTRLDRVEADATPRDRSGTVVRFAIDTIRAAVLALRDEAGAPLALGSAVRAGNGEQAVVGYDGETYLEQLQPRNELRVDTPAGACTVRFDYPADARGIARLGPLACVREDGR